MNPKADRRRLIKAKERANLNRIGRAFMRAVERGEINQINADAAMRCVAHGVATGPNEIGTPRAYAIALDALRYGFSNNKEPACARCDDTGCPFPESREYCTVHHCPDCKPVDDGVSGQDRDNYTIGEDRPEREPGDVDPSKSVALRRRHQGACPGGSPDESGLCPKCGVKLVASIGTTTLAEYYDDNGGWNHASYSEES